MNKFKQLTSIIGCTILLLILLVYWTPSAQATVLYRPNINELDADSPTIRSLKEGIKRMHRLGDTNPKSWVYQANIHGVYLSGAKYPLWNTCQHGNHYFLPWHRGYLYHFEEILRDLSGDPMLALPYWNYDSLNEKDLEIPKMFREGSMCQTWADDENCNPLYVDDTNRDAGMNRLTNPDSIKVGVPWRLGISPGQTLEQDDYCVTSFTSGVSECKKRIAGIGSVIKSFGGQYSPDLSGNPSGNGTSFGKGRLEFNPHDMIHAAVGGSALFIEERNLECLSKKDKDSPEERNFLECLSKKDKDSPCDNILWMSDPQCAASDPLFWIHHANIDRLWAEWNKGGHDNPENIWDNPIRFFDKDEKMLTYDTSTFAIEDTKCYGYTYEPYDPNEEDQEIPPSCPDVSPIKTEEMKGRILRGQSEEIQEETRTVLERLNILDGGTKTIEVATKALEELEQSASSFSNGKKGEKGKKTPVLEIKNVHYEPGAPIYEISVTYNKGGKKKSKSVGFISLFGFPQGGDISFELGEKLKGMIDNGLQVEFKEFNPVERKVSPIDSLSKKANRTQPGRPGYRTAQIGYESVGIKLQ